MLRPPFLVPQPFIASGTGRADDERRNRPRLRDEDPARTRSLKPVSTSRAGVAYASVAPHNDGLVGGLVRRIAADKTLRVHLGPGYRCFPDDFPVDLKP